MGPRHGGGGKIKRKRTYETRWRRTKRRYKNSKDVDQIQDEVKSIKAHTKKPELADTEKPGMGQFKCVICGRYFINDSVLKIHKKTKKHKKMLKKVSRPQYTQREADQCGGLGREEPSFTKKGKQAQNKKPVKPYKLMQEKLRRQTQNSTHKRDTVMKDTKSNKAGPQRFKKASNIQWISIDQV